MTEPDLIAYALGLPETVESGHFGKRDFRVRGKIFLSLPRAGEAVLKFDPDAQEMAVASAPEHVWPVKGGWGLKGWTVIAYGKAQDIVVRELVALSWRTVAPKNLSK